MPEQDLYSIPGDDYTETGEGVPMEAPEPEEVPGARAIDYRI